MSHSCVNVRPCNNPDCRVCNTSDAVEVSPAAEIDKKRRDDEWNEHLRNVHRANQQQPNERKRG